MHKRHSQQQQQQQQQDNNNSSYVNSKVKRMIEKESTENRKQRLFSQFLKIINHFM
jgi:hypothetical protein